MNMKMIGCGLVFGLISGSVLAADEVRLSQTVSDEVVIGFGQLCPALGTAGAVEASRVAENRSTERPRATLAIEAAVAGATTMTSAQRPSSVCGETDSESNSRVKG